MSDDKTTVDLKVHRISKELEPLLELRANLKVILDSRETILEYQAVSAELRWCKYSQLLNAGFSEEQALSLCQGNDFL